MVKWVKAYGFNSNLLRSDWKVINLSMIFCFKFLILQHKLAILQKNHEKIQAKGIKIKYFDIIMTSQANCCRMCIVDKTLKMQIILIVMWSIYLNIIVCNQNIISLLMFKYEI